jgi:hypothetical protein
MGDREMREINMSNKDISQIKFWIQCWKQAGVQLEQIRQVELHSMSTCQALLNLSGAFESCRRHFSPKPYSGLIEQQAWFKKYKRTLELHD